MRGGRSSDSLALSGTTMWNDYKITQRCDGARQQCLVCSVRSRAERDFAVLELMGWRWFSSGARISLRSSSTAVVGVRVWFLGSGSSSSTFRVVCAVVQQSGNGVGSSSIGCVGCVVGLRGWCARRMIEKMTDRRLRSDGQRWSVRRLRQSLGMVVAAASGSSTVELEQLVGGWQANGGRKGFYRYASGISLKQQRFLK